MIINWGGSGWYGVAKSWYTNYPEVMPVREYKGKPLLGGVEVVVR